MDTVEPSELLPRARAIAERRASGERVQIGELPSDALIVNVLGVDYVHTFNQDLGDLYLTATGFACAEHLQPDNWYDLKWFRTHRQPLEGTGSVYAVPSKPIRGENLGLVVKFSRVGERVPLGTKFIEDVLSCEFNGPFEEFSLVNELRQGRRGPADINFITQAPLAIYVPPDRVQPSQSSRFQWRVARKVAQHPGIAIDILREYIMVYGWLPGIDAWEARACGLLSEQEFQALYERALQGLHTKGFKVLDMKPQHVIVQLVDANHLKFADSKVEYGIVDFELLERTPEYAQEVANARVDTYERRTRELLETDGRPSTEPPELPPHLDSMTIFGVEYVFGRTESTGGALWVVGRDARLFDYYLPERWRTTPQLRFLEPDETYFTTSKDNVCLVWKVSCVGEQPNVFTAGPNGAPFIAHGINSPFEEMAIAWHLRHQGVPTIIPRAVYRTGHFSKLDQPVCDSSRYVSHTGLRAPSGEPILESHRNYITVWDHWRGIDPGASHEEGAAFRSVNVARAVARTIMTEEQGRALIGEFKERIIRAGVEVIEVLPSHVVVAIDGDGGLVRNQEEEPVACLCNFQYLSLPNETVMM
jgi:hypothetical protein